MADEREAGKTPAKGDLRRRQVLEAAGECFRREGFHGTSIARISRAAGMSPGHIYHYFANKEAIVEALVEQEENDIDSLIHALERENESADLLDVVSRQIDYIVERGNEPEYVSLMLEIAAEASRNPRVAQVVQESDLRLARRFTALVQRLGGPHMARLDGDPELRARLEMLPLLLFGLHMRSISNPHLDRPRMGRLMKDVIAQLWGPPA